MFIQKTFLFALFLPIGLYPFSLFSDKTSAEETVSTPTIIEPIVIPASVKEESDAEILVRLKEATKEVFEHAEPSEDEVAKEVLASLTALVKSREREKQRVIEEEKRRKKLKALKRKKEQEKRKARLRKREREKKKRLFEEKERAKKRAYVKRKEEAKRKEFARKKRLDAKRRLERKRKLAEKRKLAQKRALEKKKALALASKKASMEIRTVKKGIVLGEQHDIHTLSKDKERTFHQLEVVSASKPFALEERPNIKNPKQYHGVEKELPFDELPWVESLGVLTVSKPFLKHSERASIER